MTPIRQGPEAVAQAIAATLQANLNGDVDAQWTAWSGGDPTNELAVPAASAFHPAAYYVFHRNLIPDANYPCVVVSPAPGSTQLLNHAMLAGGAASWDLERHHVYVEVGVLAADEYTLQVATTRLVYAIRTCLLKHMALDGDSTTLLGGYGGGLDLGQFGVGRAVDFPNAQSKLLQAWGGVEVFVQLMEVVQ